MDNCPTCCTRMYSPNVAEDDAESFKALYKLVHDRSEGRHTPRAMRNLGLYYHNGRGVARSFGKAKEYWTIASGKGHGTATFELAVCGTSTYIKARTVALGAPTPGPACWGRSTTNSVLSLSLSLVTMTHQYDSSRLGVVGAPHPCLLSPSLSLGLAHLLLWNSMLTCAIPMTRNHEGCTT